MRTKSLRESGTIERLREFLSKTEKLGKYPRNTAVAMQSALRVVEEGLLPEEPDSPDYLVEHLEEIFNRQLKKLELSEGSLQAYIGRVRRVINDYQRYGLDPKALLAWKPKIKQRASKGRNGSSQAEEPTPAILPLAPQLISGSTQTALRTLVWSLRPDLSIQIQLPADLNKKDVERLKKLLDLETELTPE
jgi:hypothetical protein